MSDTSTHLILPYLAAGQAQKHVTVNEALRKLDALVQLAVVSATTAAQPGAPADGSVYVLPAAKTGAAWGAMADYALAYYRDGAWEQITPREGWIAAVSDTDRVLRFTGASWLPIVPLVSPADGVATLVNAAETGFDRLQFGGATAAFPAWKRSSAELHARLADDSGYAGVRALQAVLGAGPALAASAPALDVSQTWNNAAVSFTALRLDLTDTASDSLSKLLEFFVGGSSRFRVRKDGLVTTSAGVDLGGNSASLRFGSAVDLVLTRDAANTLAQRNGVNAQAFRIYNSYTDASNYERGFLRWAANTLEIGTENAGTGAGRSVALQAATGASLYLGGNGGTQWRINASGNLITNSDNAYDIGASAANRPRTGYFATSVVAPTVVGGGNTVTADAPVLNLTQTWNNAAVTFNGFTLSVTDTASAAASLLFNVLANATSMFRVTKGGSVFGLSSFQLNNGADFFVNATILSLKNSGSLGWSSTSNAGNAADLVLYRDAAGVLAQRNAANAQAFRLYNTFTDGSNYERGALYWTGNELRLGPQSAGTGAVRALTFETNGAARWRVTTGGDFHAVTDNTIDIGASGSNRPRNAYLAGFLGVGDGVSAPGATAGEAKIYVDAADGDLKIVFGDGVVKTIVTD